MYYKMCGRFRDISKPYINTICSKQELYDLANKSNYPELFDYWVKSNYSNKLIPSVDRIDCKKGYMIDNIQFMTKSNNSKKSIKEYPPNIIPAQSKRKKRVKLLGDNSEELFFESGKDACDFLGKDRTAISIAIKFSKPIKGYYCYYV